MTEGPAHKKANARLQSLLKSWGIEPQINNHSRGENGWQFPEIMTEKGPMEWTADTFAVIMNRPTILEVFGNKPGQGHNTKAAQIKMLFRTFMLQKYFRIFTVSFWTHELVGKKAVDDETIAFQILWVLRGKPPLSELKMLLKQSEMTAIDVISTGPVDLALCGPGVREEKAFQK